MTNSRSATESAFTEHAAPDSVAGIAGLFSLAAMAYEPAMKAERTVMWP